MHTPLEISGDTLVVIIVLVVIVVVVFDLDLVDIVIIDIVIVIVVDVFVVLDILAKNRSLSSLIDELQIVY